MPGRDKMEKAAAANPYSTMCPISPPSRPPRLPARICHAWATIDEPGMNNICIAVIFDAVLAVSRERMRWMIVRVSAMRAAASASSPNAASIAAIASWICMKMNMTKPCLRV